LYRNLAFSLYTCAWKLASEKDAPPLNLAIEKFASPENSDPEKYTGLVNSLLILKSERLKFAR
jgi:hypothetical protein